MREPPNGRDHGDATEHPLDGPPVDDDDRIDVYVPADAEHPTTSTDDRPNARGGDRTEADRADLLDTDALFDVLSDAHRRTTLHYVQNQGGEAPFEDVVEAVTERTVDGDPDYGDRRSVETTLYHVHLPKLEDVGLVADADREGTVRLSPLVAAVPWSLIESR